MMLQGGGIPPNISSSGDGATGTGGSGSSSHLHDTTTTVTVTATPSTGGGGADIGSGSGGYSEDERGRIEDSGRNSGGNRWPRQETLALLQIRSDMDVAFRDSSLKGPLWDEVSRKLAELGYHRSAKKCKEKFENVYKYHKRTKEGRTSKADGKTYRFFDQLQALEASPATAVTGHHQPPLSLAQPPPVVSSKPPHQQLNSPMPNTQIPTIPSAVTPISIAVSHQNNVDPISVAAPAVAMPSMNINHVGGFQFSQLNMSGSTNSSSSSTSSDDEPPERRSNRKRKWKDFFGKLMKEVIDKQEELQSKFLETLERRERDRMAREEAWRMQELAKMKREHELLLQERSMVAAKDAAVISFLQKITEQNPNAVIPQVPAMQLLQQQPQPQQNRPPPPPSPSRPPPPPTQPVQTMQQQQPQPQPQHQAKHQQQQVTQPLAVPVPIAVPVSVPVPAPAPPLPPPPSAVKNLDNGGGGGGDNMLQPSPSRWPKAEINALIKLRTTLDTKYQESGPKGPLWEEISLAMRKLGYNRNAKRCKEKWENINKYYKKVKESSKKRPEDSKTCPYFHQLDAIYREKASSSSSGSMVNPGFVLKPETTQMAPIMARPEQQWPLPIAAHEHQHQQQQQQHHEQQQQSKINEHGSSENHDDYDDDDDDGEEEEEDEEGGDYEIVRNKTSSMAAVE